MYYLRENSLNTEDPVFFRLRKDCMVFPEDNIVARDFALNGNYERDIISWATTLIDRKTVFLDIGAHVGTYSLAFANVCAGVHSFECSPKTFNYLCANIAMQEKNYQIIPHRTALGDTVGTTHYYLRSPKDGGGNSCMDFQDKVCESVEVPLTTLDSFKIKNIGLIKMDVEGFETKVLLGAQETLRINEYPRILFESWRPSRDSQGLPATALRQELFDTLHMIGYNQITPIRGWDEMFIAERTI